MNHIVMKKQPAEDTELINRAELSDFESVKIWMGSGLSAGGKIADEGSLYPLDGTAGTCSGR